MKKAVITYSLLTMMIIATLYFALSHGASNISLTSMSQTDLNLLLNIRLPRIVSALVAGAALSISGLFFQAAFRNPIADPGIMGVSSAAGLFQTLFGILFPAFFIGKTLAAVLGALVAFVLLIQFQKYFDPFRLIIVGVAINAVFTGIAEVVTSKASSSLATSSWSSTLILTISGVIGLIIALVLANWANYLKVSDEQLSSLGISAGFIRLVLLLLAVFLAGVTTACCGVLAFIGIIVPQVGRAILGHDYQKLTTFSIMAGSWLMLFVDTLGRTINPPNEIAAGTLLAIIGGPMMIVILLSMNRGKRDVRS